MAKVFLNTLQVGDSFCFDGKIYIFVGNVSDPFGFGLTKEVKDLKSGEKTSFSPDWTVIV